MPRRRTRNRLFELGNQWIDKEAGRPGYYRYWIDRGVGRTCRESLGTEDFEIAKQRLAEAIVKGIPKDRDSYLTLVLEQYFTDRTDHLPSAKPARNAGRLVLECWGEMVKVGGITEERNKQFVKAGLRSGHAVSYIARNLGVVAAALAHAKLNVNLIYNENAILAKWPDLKPKPPRRIFEPTDAELGQLLAQEMPENLRRWILMAMGTVGRPTAILELTPASRDRDHKLINLNPDGRRQNKKVRPVVREPRTLTTLLTGWEGKGEDAMDRDQRYCSYASESSIDTALARICAPEKANLPGLSLYSFRHLGTSVLRRGKVPKEQIDHQLGHRQGGARSTQDYGQYDPNYLSDAAKVLDVWMRRVLALAKSHGNPTTKSRRGSTAL